MKSLRSLKIFVVTVAVFTFVFSTSAMVSSGSGPSHGWFDKPIRLDYSSGGPNVRVLENTGLTINRLYSKEYSAFGYFTFDRNTGAIFESQEISFDNGDSVFIGDFAEGSNVGLWLTTDYGTSYTVPGMNDYNQSRATYLGDTVEGGDMVLGLEGGHPWFGTDYTEMIVSIEPGTSAPAGQPLPGVLVSALIGLGVAGVAGLKKRRK